jgi:beta-lactamase class A
MRLRGWGFRLLLLGSAAAALMLVVGLTGVASGPRQAATIASPSPSDLTETSPPPPEPSADPTPSPSPPPRSFASLDAAVRSLASRAGATVAVSLIELEGRDAASWALSPDSDFDAASTYKLPLLMAEAQGIAAGTISASDRLCYRSSDYEDGWYDDYSSGSCFTRTALAQRVGRFSDNTAAHILVRYLGGPDALNAYARVHGATESVFWKPNTTTSADLARLWQDEAFGDAGGSAAQAWLYPLLTDTYFEAGIPAGLPDAAVVAHKVGEVDAVVSDAALVENGPHGAYVLVVMTDDLGGDSAWKLIANVSAQVWKLEQGR